MGSKDAPIPLSTAQALGEKLMSIEVEDEKAYKKLKSWAENQSGVMMVEKNKNVKMMTRPEKSPAVDPLQESK